MLSLYRSGKQLMPFLALLLMFSVDTPAQEDEKKTIVRGASPILWRNPGNIASRNLRYGPGSAAIAPAPPYRFLEEDMGGESPKFEVKDARNVKWVVKLGQEAQSETVSTRLVWAVGYFAEEAYYFDRVRIGDLPKLSRGQKFVEGGSIVRGARFEPRRENVKRGPTWDWDRNPFADSHELNGLKVIMILLNNFDARAENNRVFYVRNGSRNEARHVVSDLGATLGRSGGLGGTRTKNNLEDFLSTRFVLGVDDGAVKFDYDTRPTRFGMVTILYPPYYRGEVKKEKSMRGIPVEHARWIGFLLAQLTDEQLRDSFRAAHYDRATMEGFVSSLRERISQLTQL